VNLSLDLELVLRIVIGTVLGAVIGYERDIHGRPAGVRTHAVVALASATFTVVSTHMVYFQNYRAGDFVEVDASRIAASVVSGIGFLAGGAILRTGFNIQGLTTAAGLWLVAAIGLCAGGGMYIESVAVTVIGIGVLTMLRRLEGKDKDVTRRRLHLTVTDEAMAIDMLIDKLQSHKLIATLEGWDQDGVRRHLTFALRLPAVDGEQMLVTALQGEPGIARMHLDPAN
jgi:putative Mg2+ transporter-C (MgtC) family protein